METILKLEQLVVNYGNIKALHGIDLEVRAGEIITLIGANGAGKTTTMNTIMGLVPVASGSVSLFGQKTTNMSTRKIVKMGVVLAPEGRQIFPELTVQDNLMLGGYFHSEAENKKTMQETVFHLFPALEDRKNQVGVTLSGGEQQMLAVGRALMASPKLLLLDEPSLGLAPLILSEIFKMIKQIREMGVTILLVEQNARMALKISDRAYALETGKIVVTDTAQALLESDLVKKAYLGEL